MSIVNPLFNPSVKEITRLVPFFFFLIGLSFTTPSISNGMIDNSLSDEAKSEIVLSEASYNAMGIGNDTTFFSLKTA